MQGKDKNSNLSERKHTNEDLKIMQGWSLERKIQVTQTRLLEWYQKNDNKCYVSFSGGKDSTVLADLTARVCKIQDCKLVLWFSDTGLEFPELKEHTKSYGEILEKKYNIEVETIIDYPKDKNGKRVTFRQVIEKYGYPLISKNVAQNIYEYRAKPDGCRGKYFDPNSDYCKKYGQAFCLEKWIPLRDSDIPISHKCCNEMKKKPAKRFEKETGLKPIVGTMTCESKARKTSWLKSGCNAFDTKRPISQPMSFWTEQDVLEYIVKCNLPYPSVYGEIKRDKKGKWYTTGQERTGCMFCGFGVHLQKEPNNFQRMKQTHPKIWEYCMKPWDEGGLGMKDVLEFIGVKIE